AYDDQNRVTEITQGGQKTKVSYQVNLDESTTTSVTDANGHVKQETASASGSVTTTSDLGDGSESITTKYTYDDRGNKISEVYANGAKKTYEYNSRNLVTKTQSYDKEGTKTLTSRYRYDDKGQLSEMTDYSVSSETETAYRYTEYSYDTRGRITTFTEISQNAQPTADDIKAHQIRYTYNENGNLSKVSYPTTKDGIQSLSYIYDENGWLQEIKGELHSKGQTTEKVLRSYSYDAYGKVKEIKDYRNRLKNGAQAVQKIYTYDSFDRVKEMTYTDLETGKVMESYRYSYDKNSNITEKTEVNNYPKEEKDKVNETKAYTYDALGRLTKTVTTDHKNDDRTKTVTYTYDKAGNRTKEDDGTTQTAYTYNGLDQLQTATKEKGTAVDEVRQYSYDANGNQTDVKNTKTGQTESYTYDAENRLSKVSVTDKDGKTAVIQQNRYNGDGQRIQKVEGSKTTNYYYQDGVVSYTTDGENSQTSQNLIGTDGNILATQRYGSDHTDYLLYHKDIQGSTTSLVKEDGSADATYRYTDFGETTINGDNKAENEVCYTGGIYDHSTGLYYLNARYYNPEDGRFVTEDTYRGETAKPETGHLYAYCANNPVNYVDPSGHKYDKHAAANYALRWGMSFNPEYANHTGQGDCTNFVSQCVHAGGVPMRRPRSVYARPDIYRTNMYWYSVRYKNYRNAYRWKETTAWTTVKGFFAHWKFKKNTKIIKCKNLEELKKKVDLGDIVQLHSRKEGWHHSIIISVKESSKICYAGHSKRHKWANINKIKKGQDKYRIIRFK
ncbi:RHS repeat domain-containing protein, partial [Anaerostipes hadrus]|uniref:RHS repeat domain-containing protein n=1 Tax=Anaerostipes hadrus TaxID=649756 RepID=UPI0035619372